MSVIKCSKFFQAKLRVTSFTQRKTTFKDLKIHLSHPGIEYTKMKKKRSEFYDIKFKTFGTRVLLHFYNFLIFRF